MSTETKTEPLITHSDFLVVWVADFDRAVDFYANTLGLKRSKNYGDRPGTEFETGNLTLAIMQADAFGQEFSPRGAPLALRVADVDAARAELESKGVEFMTHFDSGVCHQAIFRDPDGNVLILHNRYAPEDAKPGD